MSYQEQPANNTINLGPYWAALRNENVIGVIAMRVPQDVDFDTYRQKAIECLECLGQVTSGDIIERDGKRIFVQRPTHANRGKTPRPAKEYPLKNG